MSEFTRLTRVERRALVPHPNLWFSLKICPDPSGVRRHWMAVSIIPAARGGYEQFTRHTHVDSDIVERRALILHPNSWFSLKICLDPSGVRRHWMAVSIIPAAGGGYGQFTRHTCVERRALVLHM
jgi:hypothetical protein